MRVEVIQLKRCCFCIPLRYGLLIWSYIKLIIITLLICMTSFTFYMIVTRGREFYSFLPLIIMILCLLGDLAFNIVCIVGAHKKNYKLLNVFYYYSIVNIVLIGLLYLVYIGISLYYARRFALHPYIFFYVMPDFALGFVNIVLQFYLILLVRSEIQKLKNNHNFMFVNNATEAECYMVSQQADDKQLTDVNDDVIGVVEDV